MLTPVDINFLLSKLCEVRCDGGAGVASSNTALTYYPNDRKVLGSHLIMGHTFFSRLTPFFDQLPASLVDCESGCREVCY